MARHPDALLTTATLTRARRRFLIATYHPATAMTPITHHTILAGREQAWAVDPTAAAQAMAWAARSPAALAADLAGMAAYFPHWLLAGARGSQPLRCDPCGALRVPAAGAIRCPACGGAAPADGLIWLGHLPALARPEPAFAPKLAALRAAGFDQVEAGGDTYVLVPLAVAYPAAWPHVEPAVRYSRRWLAALGLPRYSAAHHLVGEGQACLFSWGQWQAMPVPAVLQQRVVNHLASLLKIAAGQPPQRAFLGRVDGVDWRPER